MRPSEIRVLRQARGMSQEALAKHLGVSPLTVSRWERGATKPLPAFLRSLEVLRTGRRGVVCEVRGGP